MFACCGVESLTCVKYVAAQRVLQEYILISLWASRLCMTSLGSVLVPRHKHVRSSSTVGVREPGRAGISHVCLVHLTRLTDQW